MNCRLILESSNSKTGNIPTSYSSPETCPLSCPWFAKGCYANDGYVVIWWRQTRDGNYPWEKFLEQVRQFPEGQLWRHNVAGDLPGVADHLNVYMVGELIEANYKRAGFTYTHKPLTKLGERMAVRQANLDGFTINLSADNPHQADRLADLGIAPVTMVVPILSSQLPKMTFWRRTPKGRKVVICPALHSEETHCKNCQLCAKPDRDYIIGFPAHGSFRWIMTDRLLQPSFSFPPP